MKYAIISSAAMIICFIIGYVILIFLRNKLKFFKGRIPGVIFTFITGLAILTVAGIIYLNNDMPAQEKAAKALEGNSSVTVRKVDGGYFFDGGSETTAFIFYPGAKVEYTAYSPLMIKLAESGFDCFLAEMPLNFSFFGTNTADRFIVNYSYDTWIIGGHSMGGTVAANYANKHSDILKGLVLLASYSTTDIESSVKVLSIYGSNDGCLEKDVYEEYKATWPEDSSEMIISGGNHSQFGDYGFQKGDNAASISPEKQCAYTAKSITYFYN